MNRLSAAARTAQSAWARAETRPVVLQMAGVAGFALLMAAAAHLRLLLPFTPIPVTLQTAVVLVSGATLGTVAGTSAQTLYLLLGATGLPFFAGGSLAGPTAGYLLAFPLAAGLVGLARRRWGYPGMLVGMVVASALILTLGSVGLALLTRAPLTAAFAQGALPFLPGDALKLLGAAGAARLVVPAWQRLTSPR